MDEMNDIQRINAKIDRLAKKRDYASDVMGHALLAWTYQDEIDKLVALLPPSSEQDRHGEGRIGMDETVRKKLDDGHGNTWEGCNQGEDCGLEILRPGVAQCERCNFVSDLQKRATVTESSE